jgi:hypothetical protein
MAFVPEGHADSSQARSAWVAMQRGPSRRDGRSRCQSQAEIGSIVPLGRGYLPQDSRHFVPGYYRAVPLGQKRFAHRCANDTGWKPMLHCFSRASREVMG